MITINLYKVNSILSWIIGFLVGISLAPKLTSIELILLAIAIYIGSVYMFSKIFSKVIK